jgi:hypothetical protein
VKTQAATDARKKKAEEKRLQEQREKSEEKKGTNKEKQQLRQTYSVIEPKTAWATTTETPARPRKRKFVHLKIQIEYRNGKRILFLELYMGNIKYFNRIFHLKTRRT